jgi:uncharacterized membrane protein YozB (DUF420 family)
MSIGEVSMAQPAKIQADLKEPTRTTKLIIGLFIGLFLAGVALFFGTGNTTHFAGLPGIFGTRANLFSDLNLIAQILLLSGLCVGFFFVRRGNISTHQYIQTGMVLFNIVMTIFIMVVAYYEYVILNRPEEFSQVHVIVSTIHAALGLLAIFCGVYLILRMNQLIPKSWRIKKYKNMMRLTLTLYLLVGLIGIGVYYFWYIY